MLLIIISFIISLVPSILIIIWLMNRRKDDLRYRKSCKSALVRGLVSVLPIIGVSLVLNILTNLLKITLLKNADVLIHEALYKFIVLAFAEELVKFLALRLLLKKKYNDYTWADVTAFMVIIGTAFGLIEDIPYAIGATPIIMLVRGITMGHVGYGFIMGWFYGKRLYTGKKTFGAAAFIIPFLIHGLYDFSLSPELLELNDNLAILGVSLAVLDIVLIVLMIRFFIKSKNKDRYNTPVVSCDPVAIPETQA